MQVAPRLAPRGLIGDPAQNATFNRYQSIALFSAATGVLDTLYRYPRFHSRSWIRQHSPQANASRLSLLRLASSPEYRLCGRSLRTAIPSAFFCPISTSSRLPRVMPV